MKPKTITKTLCGCLLIIAAGCAKQDSKPAAEGTSNEKPRVALIMKSLANEFFSTMAKGAETHQSEHADDYDLVVNGIKDERDLSRQVALVDEMVAAGVDAIVIAPADSKALVPVLRRAKQAGIVVVNIDNRLDFDALMDERCSEPAAWPAPYRDDDALALQMHDIGNGHFVRAAVDAAPRDLVA